MALQVCSGATLKCSFGVAPSLLTVLPINRVSTGTPDANILDNKPLVNIKPFGMCLSITNPEVASATAAALGVLTPMPCVPVIPAPWTPGSPTVLIANMPALNNSSILMCAWAGVISVLNAGQLTVFIP
ncbi:MAG: DUF4280 domain-containing protein [Nostoc sp. NOS(2021)]|uniref:DUF4280 domain-containing protein n=1 Tax=Nostoc sp. NOS(2021) TaxID=2815407 RepID=UPI0025EF3D2D|nr:DUF4280 domain-containing protein [Nostoc sp. NOS(2021)]MBN3895219.1 DUF4280 domain-containing protein [Nostoc sp. NOS(2021)]